MPSWPEWQTFARPSARPASARQALQQRTILFVDEVHRFNKAQQDALLPHVENGTIILIGATTENPYFAVNRALTSRSRIFQLKPLTDADLTAHCAAGRCATPSAAMASAASRSRPRPWSTSCTSPMAMRAVCSMPWNWP